MHLAHVLGTAQRPPGAAASKDHLGRHYGITIRDMKLLPVSVSQKLLELLDLTGDSTACHRVPDAATTAEQVKEVVAAEPTAEGEEGTSEYIAPDDPRLEAMYYLKTIGLALGCDVYVATNNRGRVYNGEVLGEGCVPDLRGLLASRGHTHFQYIDLLWMQRSALLSAFEVEISTGVYPVLTLHNKKDP